MDKIRRDPGFYRAMRILRVQYDIKTHLFPQSFSGERHLMVDMGYVEANSLSLVSGTVLVLGSFRVIHSIDQRQMSPVSPRIKAVQG